MRQARKLATCVFIAAMGSGATCQAAELPLFAPAIARTFGAHDFRPTVSLSVAATAYSPWHSPVGPSFWSWPYRYYATPYYGTAPWIYRPRYWYPYRYYPLAYSYAYRPWYVPYAYPYLSAYYRPYPSFSGYDFGWYSGLPAAWPPAPWPAAPCTAPPVSMQPGCYYW